METNQTFEPLNPEPGIILNNEAKLTFGKRVNGQAF